MTQFPIFEKSNGTILNFWKSNWKFWFYENQTHKCDFMKIKWDILILWKSN